MNFDLTLILQFVQPVWQPAPIVFQQLFFLSFTKNQLTKTGIVDRYFSRSVWAGYDPVWSFHLVLVDHAGSHPDRRL